MAKGKFASAVSASGGLFGDWLIDKMESNVFEAQVKVKVGPVVKLISLLANGCIYAYIVFSLATTNFYLKEETPTGSYAFWADGEADMLKHGTQQIKDGSICKYNTSFDYLWGRDNIWDYSAVTCDLRNIGSVTFKGSNDMHFITYEQRRQSITLPMVGDSCDEECSTVFPEWPSTASYGETQWKAVHVDTKLFLATKARHPTLGDVPNVHMQKPTAVGDNCRCYSFENVFNAGVESLSMTMTHQYIAAQAQKTGSSREADPPDPISFFITNEGHLFKTIERGVDRTFTLGDVLAAFDTCLDCQPTGKFTRNALCKADGTCENNALPKPVPRSSGTAFEVRTEYYSHKVNVPKAPGYNEIVNNYEPPYAIHVFQQFQDWTSRGSNSVVIEKTPSRLVEEDIYRYGVLLRLAPAAGLISRFDFQVVVTRLVEMIVVISLPKLLLDVIVFNFLGHSKILRSAQRKSITIPELYNSFTYNTVLANQIFLKLDMNRNGVLSHSELKDTMGKFFRRELRASSPEDADKRLDKLTEMMMQYFNGMGDTETDLVKWKKRSKTQQEMCISKADFFESMLAHGLGSETKEILWNDITARCEEAMSEKVFLDRILPRGLRRKMRRDAGKHEVAPHGGADEAWS